MAGLLLPRLDFNQATDTCQSGRHVSDTTNGYEAQVINPGMGLSFPAVWTPVTDPSTWGGVDPPLTQTDFAFRLEGNPHDPHAGLL